MPLVFTLTKTPGAQWHGYGTVTDTNTGMSRSYHETWVDSRDRERAVRELLVDTNENKIRNPMNHAPYREPIGPWYQQDKQFADQIAEFRRLGLL